MRSWAYAGRTPPRSRHHTLRTTVTLDDELLESVGTAIGVSERAVVLREALISLIDREAVRRPGHRLAS